MNLIALSVPGFFLLIFIELAIDFYNNKKLYRLNDALTNISLGMGQQITGLFIKGLIYFVYIELYTNHRLFTIESTVLQWVILFFVTDFLYYWFHRLSHRVNFLWAAHIVHHQSEDYNFSVALRQSWLQGWISWVVYLPLAWVGYEPKVFFTLSILITLYQFWIHTQTIGRLGWLEYIFNTPSHHSVHHASNEQYLDKNHGGTLIIWDRLFGTYISKTEAEKYGITQPLNSWNPIWANIHYWTQLWQITKIQKGIFLKIKLYFIAPANTPILETEIIISNQKFDTSTSKKYLYYIICQYLVLFGISAVVLFGEKNFNPYQLMLFTAWILFSGYIIGLHLTVSTPKSIGIEYLRILAIPLLILPFYYVSIAAVLLIVSILVVGLMCFWWQSINTELKEKPF